MVSGRKYFILLYSVLISAAGFVFARSLGVLYGLIIAGILFYLSYKTSLRAVWYYIIALPIYYMQDISYLSIVFLAGFPLATLHSLDYVKNEKIKNWRGYLLKILKIYSPVLVVTHLPLLLSYF